MTTTTCPTACRWQALLEDGAGDDAGELIHHLESCAACQQTLERLAAEPTDWQDTQQLMDGGATDPALDRVVEQLKCETPLAEDDADLSFLSAADNPDLLGTLGSYEVQQEIGRGGMGIVLKALDPALHRTVALKVLSPCLASSRQARQRFLREGRAAAAVAHENIVPVFGVCEAAGLPYLVMQYVAGESLQDRLQHAEPLPLVDIVRIGMQTAAGLAAAHASGLIHRDIKPANLLLDSSGRILITDFGLARTMQDVQVTQAGVVAGTPEFMAPEQARGETVDHRADLFSLGSVLFALCTGRAPFAGSTTLGVLRQVADQAPCAVRALNPDVPAWLAQFIERLMQKDPAQRVQSAAEAAGLLGKYLTHLQQPETSPPPALPFAAIDQAVSQAGRRARLRAWCRRHPRRAALGLAAMLVLALGCVWWLRFSLAPSPDSSTSVRFYHDFRDSAPLPACARLIGVDRGSVVRSEDGGLRITLPAQQASRVRVGLELSPTIKGDFVITASYQIVAVDLPKAGEGVGAELYVGTAPLRDGLGVMRLRRVAEGDVYMVNRSSNQGGKMRFRHSIFPTAATSGRLRMTRCGKDVTVCAAEGSAGEFRELCQYELGPEDVAVIWLTAFAGGSQHGVDVRFLDLDILADGVTADGVDFPLGLPAPGSRWAAVLLITGSIITCLLPQSAARRRGRRGHGAASGQACCAQRQAIDGRSAW